MDVAWKDAHVSGTSLTEAIGLVRQALGDDPQKPEFIQTVHRRGYRFIAPVTTDVPAPQATAVPDRPPLDGLPGVPVDPGVRRAGTAKATCRRAPRARPS